MSKPYDRSTDQSGTKNKFNLDLFIFKNLTINLLVLIAEGFVLLFNQSDLDRIRLLLLLL